MANAAAKRTAAQNETAIRNLNIGMGLVNVNFILFRYLFNKTFLPWWQVILYVLTLIPSVLIYRWLVISGTPVRDDSGLLITPGEDLSQPGLMEYAFDIIYVTWACQLGSALLGTWAWYLYLIIPGYALYRLSGFILPMLKSGAQGVVDAASAGMGGGADANEAGTPPQSKRQAKLQKRAERGDSRIKQVKRSA